MRAIDHVAKLQAKLASGDLHPDEPLFTLRGRDSLAEHSVRRWIQDAELVDAPTRKIGEAVELLHAMRAWPVKRIPGHPSTQTGELPPLPAGQVLFSTAPGSAPNDKRDRMAAAIQCAASYLHDATRWDQRDEADDDGTLLIDRLLDELMGIANSPEIPERSPAS